MRDDSGKYLPNQDQCRAGLHPWPESAVERGGVVRCRECTKVNSRRYKAKKRKPVPLPPTTVEWRDIPGYEGLYQVSEHGDVWRIAKSTGTSGGALRAIRRGRYWKVDLYKESVGQEFRVHVLVALVFIGSKPDWAEVVRHLDDDADNNHFTNLAYGTHSDNQRDRYTNNPSMPWLTESIRDAIRDDPRSRKKIADEYGIFQATVGKIKREGTR